MRLDTFTPTRTRGCMPQQHRFAHPSRTAKRTPGEWCDASSLHGARFSYFTVLLVLYCASTGFIAVATALGCSPSIVTRIPFVQAAALVGTYMGLARPEKRTGHVPTFNHSEIENLGVQISYQHAGLLRHFFSALAASRQISQVARESHKCRTTFLNIRPCASNRDEYAGSNHEIDGFNLTRDCPLIIPIFISSCAPFLPG